MNADLAKPKSKIFTAARLKAVGRWALLWLVMWLAVSLMEQAFFLKDLIFLPLILMDAGSGLGVAGGLWSLWAIWTFSFVIGCYAAKPNWEFLLQAFAWYCVLEMRELPVGEPLKWAAVAGFTLWVWWAGVRVMRERRGVETVKIASGAEST